VKNTLQTFNDKVASYFEKVDGLMKFEKLMEDAANEKKQKAIDLSSSVVNKAEAKATAKASSLSEEVASATKQKSTGGAIAIKHKAIGVTDGSIRSANEELKVLEDRVTKAILPLVEPILPYSFYNSNLRHNPTYSIETNNQYRPTTLTR